MRDPFIIIQILHTNSLIHVELSIQFLFFFIFIRSQVLFIIKSFEFQNEIKRFTHFDQNIRQRIFTDIFFYLNIEVDG